MIAVSSVAFLLSDGEKRRLRWVQAMRKYLTRLACVLRYEQPELARLLLGVELRATPQERLLTKLMQACARQVQAGASPGLLFAAESAKLAEYGVLSEEDRQDFEAVLAELGSLRLEEQLQAILSAQERLRRREEELSRECVRRTRMIRTLGAAGGAAAFLILI